LGVAVAVAPSSARAQTIEATAPQPPRSPTWELAAGVRTVYVKSAGFDPFSDNDAFPQLSISGTRTVVRSNRLSLAAGIGLDVGSSTASARGDASELNLTRLAAVIEARVQPRSRFYLFARVAPGLLHLSASLQDASSPEGSSLHASADVFSVDASAGGALRLGGIGTANIGAWLIADGGYAWASSREMVVAPSLGADQNKAGSVDLGNLAARGGFFRLALGLSY
jgi:hypothetical protein